MQISKSRSFRWNYIVPSVDLVAAARDEVIGATDWVLMATQVILMAIHIIIQTMNAIPAAWHEVATSPQMVHISTD